eukprot:41713_1
MSTILRVTDPEGKARVYAVKKTLNKSDEIKIMTRPKQWYLSKVNSVTTDTRRRKYEDYLFDRIRICPINDKQAIELAKLKGSDGPWLSPVPISFKGMINGKSGWIVCQKKYFMKPSVFDNQYKSDQKSKNTKNKSKTKPTKKPP